MQSLAGEGGGLCQEPGGHSGGSQVLAPQHAPGKLDFPSLQESGSRDC